MTGSSDLARLVAEVGDRARQVRRQLDAGRPVDLTMLETDVGRLRAAATVLSPASVLRTKPAMLALLAELDELYAILRAGYGEAQAQLDDMGARRRAVSAYSQRR